MSIPRCGHPDPLPLADAPQMTRSGAGPFSRRAVGPQQRCRAAALRQRPLERLCRLLLPQTGGEEPGQSWRPGPGRTALVPVPAAPRRPGPGSAPAAASGAPPLPRRLPIGWRYFIKASRGGGAPFRPAPPGPPHGVVSVSAGPRPRGGPAGGCGSPAATAAGPGAPPSRGASCNGAGPRRTEPRGRLRPGAWRRGAVRRGGQDGGGRCWARPGRAPAGLSPLLLPAGSLSSLPKGNPHNVRRSGCPADEGGGCPQVPGCRHPPGRHQPGLPDGAVHLQKEKRW